MCSDSSPFHDAPTRNSAPTIPAPASEADRRATAKWNECIADQRERAALRQVIREALGGDLKAQEAKARLALLMLEMRDSA